MVDRRRPRRSDTQKTASSNAKTAWSSEFIGASLAAKAASKDHRSGGSCGDQAMRIGVTANVGGDPERVRYPVVALWPGYPTSSLAVWVMRNSLVPNDRQPAAAPTAWLDGAKRGGGLAHPYPISRPQRRSDCAVGPDGNGWDALKRGSGWPPTSRPMVSVGTFASPRSCTAPRWAGTSTFT